MADDAVKRPPHGSPACTCMFCWAEIERLRAEVADLHDGINWEVTCLNCAKLMNDHYDQHCEIERLQAEIERLRINIGELIALIVRRDDEIVRLRAEIADLRDERDHWVVAHQELRAVVDALVARPFRGTSAERRDRMYGSDWDAVHDALDALGNCL